jgi:hypothetical protein
MCTGTLLSSLIVSNIILGCYAGAFVPSTSMAKVIDGSRAMVGGSPFGQHPFTAMAPHPPSGVGWSRPGYENIRQRRVSVLLRRSGANMRLGYLEGTQSSLNATTIANMDEYDSLFVNEDEKDYIEGDIGVFEGKVLQ